MEGRTLLELLVSLAIASIVSAAAVPHLSDSFARIKLRGKAERIASVLRQGRLEAQNTARPSLIKVSSADNGLFFLQNGRERWRYHLKDSYQLNGNRTEIHLSERGTTSPAAITVSGRGGSCRVSLALRGRVRVSCKED